MSHPSDLVLEQYLHGEPVSPSVARHVETCDDCWRRWEHLHADAGWAPPVRAVLPAPANSPNWPWFLAGAATAVALATLVLPTGGDRDAAATVVQLEQEVATLRSEVQAFTKRARLNAVESSVGVAQTASSDIQTAKNTPGAPSLGVSGETQPTGPAMKASTSRGQTPAHQLSSSPMTEEERLSRLQVAMNKHSDMLLGRLDQWLDDMVDTTKIDESTAQKVVDLIQYELVETTDLKADAKLGLLSGMEAREDWGILRQETDAALLDVLGDAALVKELRAVTDAKK